MKEKLQPRVCSLNSQQQSLMFNLFPAGRGKLIPKQTVLPDIIT